MAGTFSISDLEKMGAKPLWGQGEIGGTIGNVGASWRTRGGESVSTMAWLPDATGKQVWTERPIKIENGKYTYLDYSGATRPLDQIKYQLPNGEIFQYQAPTQWDTGYSGAGTFKQISGPELQGAENPYDLISSGQYRDVPGNIIPDWQTGKLSTF